MKDNVHTEIKCDFCKKAFTKRFYLVARNENKGHYNYCGWRCKTADMHQNPTERHLLRKGLNVPEMDIIPIYKLRSFGYQTKDCFKVGDWDFMTEEQKSVYR